MKLTFLAPINIVLLFLLATMGGTLWFLLPTRETMEQARRTRPDTPAAPTTGAGKQAAVDPAELWRARLMNSDRGLRTLRQINDRTASEIAQLTAGNAAAPATPAADAQNTDKQDAGKEEARKLAETLAQHHAELASLQLAADRSPAVVDVVIPSGTRLADQGKEAVWLQLYADRVLPVDDRYYSVRTIDSSGIAFRVLRRTSVGETFSEASASGSKFGQILSGIVPGKQYLRCLVADDSFAMLRGVMKLAQEKGIDVQWDLLKDEDGRIVFSPRQSGSPATPH
jgi:hypothetical protein